MICHEAEGVMVAGDAGWLERLLLILLDNAIKFTPEGGQISVTVSCEKRLARVAVTDTGVGIPRDELPHVFERFYRANPALSRPTQGAGLGLALAKWIADCHHGTIEVKSQSGTGSTFTLTLPALSGRLEAGASSASRSLRMAPASATHTRIRNTLLKTTTRGDSPE